jgi:hypothetical protein
VNEPVARTGNRKRYPPLGSYVQHSVSRGNLFWAARPMGGRATFVHGCVAASCVAPMEECPYVLDARPNYPASLQSASALAALALDAVPVLRGNPSEA